MSGNNTGPPYPFKVAFDTGDHPQIYERLEALEGEVQRIKDSLPQTGWQRRNGIFVPSNRQSDLVGWGLLPNVFDYTEDG